MLKSHPLADRCYVVFGSCVVDSAPNSTDREVSWIVGWTADPEHAMRRCDEFNRYFPPTHSVGTGEFTQLEQLVWRTIDKAFPFDIPTGSCSRPSYYYDSASIFDGLDSERDDAATDVDSSGVAP